MASPPEFEALRAELSRLCAEMELGLSRVEAKVDAMPDTATVCGALIAGNLLFWGALGALVLVMRH
jgi:hypothetical protein